MPRLIHLVTGQSGENKVRSKCSLFDLKILKNRSKHKKEWFKAQGSETLEDGQGGAGGTNQGGSGQTGDLNGAGRTGSLSMGGVGRARSLGGAGREKSLVALAGQGAWEALERTL